MSVCEQPESPKMQEKCKYYEKATREHRCMYLTYSKFCDCLKAQLDRKSFSSNKIKQLLEENQKKIEDAKASEATESQIERTEK